VKFVVLDSSPLGLLTFPRARPATVACDRWLQGLIAAGVGIAIPEIVDYEVRRELLRERRMRFIGRLEILTQAPSVTYLPLTTTAMRLAAEYWAMARRSGRPTADPHALDGDVIPAAQVRLAVRPDDTFIVATTNVRRLALFVPAAEWWTITP
jgi:hypothetical protein